MLTNLSTKSLLALLALIAGSDAFWRLSYSVIQTGRIDPIVSSGKAASHAYKISGPSNIGLSSTFDELQPAIINEPVTGTISTLPGCITITNGPKDATDADIVCAAGEDTASFPSSADAPSPTAPDDASHPVISARANVVSSAVSAVVTALSPVTSIIASIVGFSNGYVVAGCYTDTDGSDDTASKITTTNGTTTSTIGHALNGIHYTSLTGMTVDACTLFCSVGGYPFAGVEAGEICYCGLENLGNKIASNSTNMEGGCNIPCTGNAAELCGGTGLLEVYQSG